MLTLPQVNERAPPLDLASLPATSAAGLYVHVPFCFHKCHYCDFYSITRQTPERMEAFVDRVLREADLWRGSPVGRSPTSVFFGGGTPSLLPHAAMARLLRGLRERFDLGGVAEWTVEVNPATADGDYLRMLRDNGVDRLSLGAQTFDPTELRTLERHHDPADVDAAIAMARIVGFERLSIDLIYAIPEQTLASWRRSLDRAIALGLEHVSCYGLTYEPNTPMTVRKRLGRIVPAEESLEVAMFRLARSRLADAGLSAYEISNHARPGRESLHNLAYWLGESYIGLGPSAASHVEGTRFRNTPHLRHWEQAIDAGQLGAIDAERLHATQRASELAMLNLRLTAGIETADFIRRTGSDPRVIFADAIGELRELGLLADDDGHLRLTDAAWPVADSVAARFFS